MAFTIERIKSFLAKRRLPQFGQDANKDTYSVSLLLFQLCEHDKHFIFHPLFEPEAFHLTMPHFLPPNIIWAIIEFQLRHLLVVESEYKTHPFPGVHNSGFDGHLQ